ncbi:MAG: type II toxin-antitoxin system Phd/YefM family antitoxin [Thermodesulfovibrionales bacterium]|jgi:prevent-host-death family protein
MKIKEDIKPISYLKSRSADLISQINETHRPVIITKNGEPRAVIQDVESYEKTINSLNLIRILAHGEKAIQKEDTLKQKDLFKRIDENLMKRKTHR